MPEPSPSQTVLIVEGDDGGYQVAGRAPKREGCLIKPQNRRVHGREALDDLIERIDVLAQLVVYRFDVALSPDIL